MSNGFVKNLIDEYEHSFLQYLNSYNIIVPTLARRITDMSEEVKLELDRYIQYISSLSGVLKIYLFGSYAYGEPRKTSDIDLMIIVENNLDPFMTAYGIRRRFANSDLDVDIVVNRVSAFEEASAYSLFQKTIKENGVLLYVA